MTKKKKVKLTKNKSQQRTAPKRRLPKIEEPLSLKLKLLTAALMAVLAMALYAPSHNYNFVYDDDAVVQDNRFVHKGLDGLKEIWTSSYFQGYNPNMNVNAFRPVPLTTFAIEYQSAGNNPGPYHITQIVLYGLTGFFLFLFLSTLLYKYHPILPIMATLLFVVHPLHVEVVANIKSRDELLAFLNFAIAAWLLLKYIDTRKIWLLVPSLLAFSIALFSKESAVTTLAIIPAMLYFFREIKWSKILLTLAPYLGLVIIFLICRDNVIGNNPIESKFFDNSLLAAKGVERVSSNIMVLGFYLFKSIFPHPLISDYSYNTLPNVDWANYKVYLSLLAYGGLIYFLFKGLFRKKAYSFAIFYYFATISIFSSVLFPGFSVYNDRFLYHPVLGICLLISCGLYHFIKKDKEGFPSKDWRTFLSGNAIVLAIIVLLSSLAIFKLENRLPDWKDRYVLFEKDVKKAPNNARMRKNYGGSLARQAIASQSDNPELAKEYANQAIVELEAALKIYERQSTGYVHLGNMHTLLGNYPQAEDAFNKALSIDSRSHHAQVNLANIYYRTGRYLEAINLLEGMSRAQFTQNDYYLLSLAWSRFGDEAKAQDYRVLSGR